MTAVASRSTISASASSIASNTPVVMIRRSASLIVFLVVGYVLGDLVTHLAMIPVAAIKHFSNGVGNTLSAI